MRAVTRFVRVLPSLDLAAREGLESQIRCVPVGDQMILVGRLQSGQVVAFAASCPHETTDLSQATFVGGNVRCPRHNYLYNPDDGHNVIPTEISRPENLWKLRPGYLTTYRVDEHDGWVWVSERPNAAPASWDPATQERPTGPSDPATTAPPAPPAALSVPVAPREHPLETLRVRVGGELEMRLPTDPKPAFMWRIELPDDLLAIVAQSFDPAACPPVYHVRLQARGAGETTVRCSYRRPWDNEPAEIRTYLVAIQPR